VDTSLALSPPVAELQLGREVLVNDVVKRITAEKFQKNFFASCAHGRMITLARSDYTVTEVR
jgi:hypothetical protein